MAPRFASGRSVGLLRLQTELRTKIEGLANRGKHSSAQLDVSKEELKRIATQKSRAAAELVKVTKEYTRATHTERGIPGVVKKYIVKYSRKVVQVYTNAPRTSVLSPLVWCGGTTPASSRPFFFTFFFFRVSFASGRRVVLSVCTAGSSKPQQSTGVLIV